MGTIYLLCFAPGLRRDARAFVRHYLGWTSRTPQERLAEHLSGNGCPLVKAAADRGLKPEIVRTWKGTRQDERALKRSRNLPRLCPRCAPKRVRATSDLAHEIETASGSAVVGIVTITVGKVLVDRQPTGGVISRVDR